MEKTAGQLLKEKLEYKRKNGGMIFDDAKKGNVMDFCEGYKTFLDNARTERHAVNTAVVMLQEAGFEAFDKTKKYKAGDRVYSINRGKTIISTVFGTEPIENGVKMVASHIDSPRLDLKPHPLYEEAQMAFLKTHYYGGIKKYQWTSIPLALLGVIVKQDGTIVDVNIGLDPKDPVLCVNDLLPHLGKDQGAKNLNDAITGEQLNLIVGLDPYKDEKVQERVKLNILRLLNEKYDIVEEDFVSAELEAVPCFDAKDVGLDRSMVGAYGQDDRVCAYASLIASIEATTPKYTTVNVLADKEETGSGGNTGVQSEFLRTYIFDLAAIFGANGRDVLSKSKCLSADVSAGFDPNFADVYEKNNSSYLNHGTALVKYTGSRGKSGTSDANAEFTGEIRTMLNENNILWQTAELGKIDQGGGGTVAVFLAKLNIDVIDIGVPVLSMHAPFEVVSKIDVYSTYEACLAFLNN